MKIIKNWKNKGDIKERIKLSETLADILEEAGFTEVRKYRSHQLSRAYYVVTASFDTKHNVPPIFIKNKKTQYRYHLTNSECVKEIIDFLKKEK